MREGGREGMSEGGTGVLVAMRKEGRGSEGMSEGTREGGRKGASERA